MRRTFVEEIFVDRGRFCVLELWSFRLYLGASSCIFFWLMMYIVLFELSLIGGDTLMYLYLFLVSHCATLIYEVIQDICLVVYAYVKSRIYFILLVFSTHAFMHLLSVSRNIQVNSVVLLFTLATDKW